MNQKLETFFPIFTGDITGGGNGEGRGGGNGEGKKIIVFGEDIRKSKQTSYLISLSCILLWLCIGIFMAMLMIRNKDSNFLK